MRKLRIEQCDAFNALGLVAHGMSGGGAKRWSMSLRSGDERTVMEARAAFGQAVGIPVDRLVMVNQVHGRSVLRVGEDHAGCNGGNGRDAGPGDALITDVPGLPLAILIADCVPVFLIDPAVPAIGLAHAGWRGTDARIAAATVGAMKKDLGAEPERMMAWLGPSIGGREFRVSEELYERFHVQFEKVDEAFDAVNQSIDLKLINEAQLIKAGLQPGNVHRSPYCTVESDGFFSYRRDGKGCGHMMAAIMLRAPGVSAA